MTARVFVHLDPIISQSAFFVFERPRHEQFQLLDAQWLELEDLRTGDERAIDVEKGVIGGRADEPQISRLYVRQQNVLLRLVEMMNLIDEHDRFSFGCSQPIGSSGDEI